MLPSSEEIQDILTKLKSFDDNRGFQNYISQVQSRYILQGLDVPEDNWPGYRFPDIQLQETAHYLLWQGLQLKQSDEYSTAGDSYIKRASEILEFLFSEQEESYERTVQLFNAALGYYISGYYARSYVLMGDVELGNVLPNELEILRLLFRKEFSILRNKILAVLEDEDFIDSVIASDLRQGSITEDEGLHRVFQATFNRAISYFIEYPKTGLASLLEQARELLDDGIQLSLKTGFAEWWWLYYCARYLIDKYDDNSFWNQLAPMGGGDEEYVRKYILANYSRSIPIIELWHSQIRALPRINEEKRGSYCLKMPTSSGKTRVAELTILRFLLDYKNDQNAKCVYLAPFRSLAVEVEETLQKSFHPLGARVSEIYGGFELSPIERWLIEQTKILVATPEKFDAYLRYNPELADSIRLIVIDEGHIISLSERGLRFELFFHRIIRRFRPRGVRFLFISAVLPNTDEFAKWITGNSEDVVQTDWRPSRLLLGELRWNGLVARIEYLENDHSPLGHECYIPNFIRPVHLKDVFGGRYRRWFPRNITEAVAEAGVRFASQGSTMIFCTQKRSVNTVARSIEESIRIHRTIARKVDKKYSLPVAKEARDSINRCIDIVDEYMGSDNDVSRFLREGFAIHHSDIPKRVRLEIEKLVRSGVVSLLVATTTLAQGVNLPIRTVIVHGLSHGDDNMTPVTFWNICGRAGRAMRENQGQVLFAVDLDLPKIKLNDTTGLSEDEIANRTQYKRERTIENRSQLRGQIIDGYRDFRLASAWRLLIEEISNQWFEDHPNLNIIELCEHLAENDLNWFSNDRMRARLIKWLDVVDMELLALVEEENPEIVSPDTLQELLEGSLLFLQAGEIDTLEEKAEQIKSIVYARWRYIHTFAPNHDLRSRFYRLGFPMADCQRIESNVDELWPIMRRAVNYESWSVETRCNYLIELISFIVLHVEAVSFQASHCEECWEQILFYWLNGETPNEISVHSQISQYVDSPAEIAKFIDDSFGYKLPWALNAITVYLGSFSDIDEDLPEIVSYFSALIKYGVHAPVAASLLAIGLKSRKLALILASHYEDLSTSPQNVFAWISSLGVDELNLFGLSESEIGQVHSVKQYSDTEIFGAKTKLTELVVTSKEFDAFSALRENDLLTLRTESGTSSSEFSLLDLWGNNLGVFDYQQELPSDWKNPQKNVVRVRAIEKTDRVSRLNIVVESMA